MNRRQFVSAVLITASSGALARGARGASRRALDRIVRDYVATNRLAGAAVAISDQGSATSLLQAGRIALGSQLAFGQNSFCRLYAITKPVTGLTAMLLVEDGLLALDQPMADILPEFRRLSVATGSGVGLESCPATRTMTIRHLLTHSSGLSYWTPQTRTDALSSAYRARGITPGNYYASTLARPGYGPQANGLADMVKRLSELPLAAEPGTQLRYSVGLDVVGAASWNCAAGTMWLLDPVRRLNLVFMSQFMPPTAYPIWTEVAYALRPDSPT